MKRGKFGQRNATQVDMSLGDKIRSRRIALGFSQSELGQSVGLSFQQIQKYERGLNRVSAGRLTAIAKVLDVPLGFFYGPQETVTAATSLLDLDTKSQRVAKAFARIRSRKVKHQIVMLAERLAEERD